jgi:hypothetical protein
MTLFTRWIVATVGAAIAAYMLTLPIYRYAASVGLGDRFTHWQAAGSLIELIVYVAVTYWALAPEFPKLRLSRYAAWTLLPTLIVLVLWAMVDADVHGSAGAAAPASQAEPSALSATLIAAPILLAAAWGLFSLQWLSLSEAAEGYRPWIIWSIAGTVAMVAVSVAIEQASGGSLFADLSTPGRQLAAYASAVATSSAFGIVSAFGVAQLRPKP